MAVKVSQFRVRSAEQRVGFLEVEAEQWLRDHREAQACGEYEELLDAVNGLFTELLQLDNRLQEAYFDGMAYDEELSRKIANFFPRWLALAQSVEGQARRFASKGYSVEGLDDLRKNILEAEGCVNPSDETGDWIEKLRDAALAQHDRGETAGKLID